MKHARVAVTVLSPPAKLRSREASCKSPSKENRVVRAFSQSLSDALLTRGRPQRFDSSSIANCVARGAGGRDSQAGQCHRTPPSGQRSAYVRDELAV